MPLPTVEELVNNISIILVNSHRSIAPPRPLMPGIINIGGSHIQPTKPLPDDIQVSLYIFVTLLLSADIVSSSVKALRKHELQILFCVIENYEQFKEWCDLL